MGVRDGDGLVIGGAQVGGQHGQQLLLRYGLYRLVGGLDVRVVVLDGGGHIAGKDLTGVVIQGRHRHHARVGLPAEALVLNDGQGMGQHCHHVGVLLDVLRVGVAHQAPAADVAHPGDHGEEMIGHGAPLPLLR